MDDVMTFRVTETQRAKLTRLALQTGRSRGAVLRLLIEQAKAQEQPDVVLEV